MKFSKYFFGKEGFIILNFSKNNKRKLLGFFSKELVCPNFRKKIIWRFFPQIQILFSMSTLKMMKTDLFFSFKSWNNFSGNFQLVFLPIFYFLQKVQIFFSTMKISLIVALSWADFRKTSLSKYHSS